MKARVRATGEIIFVKVYNKGFDYNGRQFINYEDMKSHKIYADNQLDFDNTDNTPDDYWTRLEHQAVIAAMGGLCGNTSYDEFTWETAAEDAISAAHILVEKLKEKEEK